MEENIGLFTVDWYIGGCTFSDGVRWCCYILVALVFVEFLRWIRRNGLLQFCISHAMFSSLHLGEGFPSQLTVSLPRFMLGMFICGNRQGA